MALAVTIGFATVVAVTPAHAAVTAQGVVALAEANVGDMACSVNSEGGTSYDNSCSGNGGSPEFWCADFAMWVWQHSGVTDMSGLTAMAQSFYTYASARGILSTTPHLGDVAIFSGSYGDTTADGDGIHHVAIVSEVNSDGTIETISGDWGGSGTLESQFASSSHVVLNTPAYSSKQWTHSTTMGMYVVGFVSPPGMLAQSSANPIYHTIRDASGSWTGWGELQGYNGAASFDARDTAISDADNGSSQVIAIGSDGNLYHEIRDSSGNWSGWGELTGFNGAASFQARAVSIGVDPSDLSSQVVAIGSDGNLYHEIRDSSGNWSGWGELKGFNGAASFQASAVAIAVNADGSSQVIAIGGDGNVYHEIRQSSGTWSGWGALKGFNGAATFQARAVSIGINPYDGSSQVIAIGGNGNVYHDLRQSSGTWSGWGELTGFNGAASFQARAVSIAVDPTNSTSQVIAIGDDGNVYHEIRDSSGNWTGWGEVKGINSATGFNAAQVSISVDASHAAQVVATYDGN